LRPEEKIESFCLFILIGMDAVPVYHENGYDALDPADGALRQMTAHGDHRFTLNGRGRKMSMDFHPAAGFGGDPV
jgi:hypothetical protein